MRRLGSLYRNNEGGVAIAFGLAVVVLGGFVGLAIDTARAYNVTRKVEAALDAAALAGAKLMNQSDGQAIDIQQVALATFRANTVNMSIGDVTFSNFTAVPNTSNSSVRVGVRIKLPAIFGRIAGLDEFDVGKAATTNYSLAKIEVVLALDVTGSMNDTAPGDSMTKLAAMKQAANSLADALYAEATTDSNVRISLVPWSSGIQAGAYARVITGGAMSSGCFVERAGDGATTDTLPSNLTYALPMPASSLAAGYVCPTAEVVALKGRQEAANLRGRINGLQGAGGTAGHLGASWAWYMLSSNWANEHPLGSRPEPVSSNVIKAAVIMTDGVFNTSHVGGVLNSGSGGYNDQSYTMFTTLCEGMRQQGIRVYTVAFDLADSYAVGKLADCAGSNALSAANSQQLHDLFKSIAQDITSIRITN